MNRCGWQSKNGLHKGSGCGCVRRYHPMSAAPGRPERSMPVENWDLDGFIQRFVVAIGSARACTGVADCSVRLSCRLRTAAASEDAAGFCCGHLVCSRSRGIGLRALGNAHPWNCGGGSSLRDRLQPCGAAGSLGGSCARWFSGSGASNRQAWGKTAPSVGRSACWSRFGDSADARTGQRRSSAIPVLVHRPGSPGGGDVGLWRNRRLLSRVQVQRPRASMVDPISSRFSLRRRRDGGNICTAANHASCKPRFAEELWLCRIASH